MREFLNRLLDLFRRRRLDAELREELRFHREMLARDAAASQGASGASGARDAGAVDPDTRAARALGNVTGIRERARAVWGFPFMDQFAASVRQALRGIVRNPGFATAVVLTLGLGIGANAAMFGVVDRLMFRPYPMLRDPSMVHRVYLRATYRGQEQVTRGFEYTRYTDLQKWTQSFSQIAAFTSRDLAVGTGDDTHERRVEVVSAEFFRFFDAPPARGRYFADDEVRTPKGADVVVISYPFWQSQFGGADDVLGKTIVVNNTTATVIGVAPRGFQGVEDDQPPEIYLPITTYAAAAGDPKDRAEYFTRYNWGWHDVMVRRKPGVTQEAADRDLSQAYVRSWNAEREQEPQITPADIARPNALAGAMKDGAGPDPSLEARTALWVTGVAAIVLLIACANVANLFLARALRRRREIAVRLALGVTRRRLLAEALTESLLLSVLGSAIGLLLAQWGGSALRTLLFVAGPAFDVVTDRRTVLLAAALACVTGVVTGVAPLVFGVRGDLAGALKAGAREGTYQRSRTRATLLVMQGALSVVLLVGAGLFVRSLNHVSELRMGYDAKPVLFAERVKRGTIMSDSETVALRRRLMEAAQSLPEVESAAWAAAVPFYSTMSTNLFVAGIDSVRKLGRFAMQYTTPDYFHTMSTRIVRGRGLLATDRAGAPRVAVVSESMARALWPGQNALGQCMKVGADTMPCTEIVGVAEDAIQNSLTDDKHLDYYLPVDQARPQAGFALLARMRGDPATHQEALRKALQAVMPGIMYVNVRPLSTIIDSQRRSWKVGATMFVAFGLLALVVAAVGLYSVIGYTVAQRMHELGVRVALGAQGRDIVRLVLSQGLRFGAAGVLVGAAIALAGGKFLRPLLFQESPYDPVVFASVGVVLIVVAAAASINPALRASRADPNVTLRTE